MAVFAPGGIGGSEGCPCHWDNIRLLSLRIVCYYCLLLSLQTKDDGPLNTTCIRDSGSTSCIS